MIKETTPQIPLTITRTSIFTGLAATLLAVGLGLAPSASAQVQPQTPAGTFTEQKVTASDGTANTFFGSAAAIKGTHAVIGADGDASFAAPLTSSTRPATSGPKGRSSSRATASEASSVIASRSTTATCS